MSIYFIVLKKKMLSLFLEVTQVQIQNFRARSKMSITWNLKIYQFFIFCLTPHSLYSTNINFVKGWHGPDVSLWTNGQLKSSCNIIPFPWWLMWCKVCKKNTQMYLIGDFWVSFPSFLSKNYKKNSKITKVYKKWFFRKKVYKKCKK